MSEPRTIWEDQDGVRSGGSGMIRAAAFRIGDGERTGVAITIRVPESFYQLVNGRGASATLLITANEARRFAAWLNTAADAADAAGSPLYE